MEGIGLALAVPGAIDNFMKLGNILLEKLENYKNASAVIQEMEKFGIGLIEGQFKGHLRIAISAMNDPSVDEEMKMILDNLLFETQVQLVNANASLGKHTTKGRLHFAFIGEPAIKKVLRNLQGLQGKFYDAMSTISLKKEMTQPNLFLPKQIFSVLGVETEATPGDSLPYSEIFIVHGYRAGHGVGNFILEGIGYFPGNDEIRAERDAQALASKLSKADFPHGIPRLIGYRHAPFRNSYELVFELPPDCESPRSLYDLLLDRNTSVVPSLTSRLSVCYQLAKAVLFTHYLGIVHKNIRPQNLLLLPPKQNTSIEGTICSRHLGTLFLTHWEMSRNADDTSTQLRGAGHWQQGIYQHPTRQGARAEEAYVMNHDIYSLGVCMLEILLWRPFVEEDNNHNFQISMLYQQKAVEGGLVNIRHLGKTNPMVASPRIVQSVFVGIAETELPPVVGDKMAELVVNCLNSVEGGFGTYFVEGQDELEGLKYMFDVLSVFPS